MEEFSQQRAFPTLKSCFVILVSTGSLLPLSHVFRTLGMHPIKPYSTKILLGIHLSFFIKFQIKTVGKVCNSAWKKMKLKCFLLDLIALYRIISARWSNAPNTMCSPWPLCSQQRCCFDYFAPFSLRQCNSRNKNTLMKTYITTNILYTAEIAQ